MSSGGGLAFKEVAMAKTKKRSATRKSSATRKKSAKRSKASVKPARKKTAKRATAKKAKSKVRRATKRANKPTAKPAPADTGAILADAKVGTTIVAAIEKPTGGVVVVEECASVRATPSALSGRRQRFCAARRDQPGPCRYR